MKRTTLMLDEELLDLATQLAGSKTYTATVNLALKELISIYKARQLDKFIGSGVWKGNLSEIREDKKK